MNLLVYTDSGIKSEGVVHVSIGVSIRLASSPKEEISCESSIVAASTILEGEYLAAIRGIVMAREMKPDAIILCTDSLAIVQGVHGVGSLLRFLKRDRPEQLPPEFILRLLRQRLATEMAKGPMRVFVRHVGRENNYRADALARAAFFG